MAPRTKTSSHQEKETLRHFTHPQHVLMKQAFEDIQNEGYDNDEFVCDGCGMDGSGVRYHCKQCGFDLHEDCATCTEDLTSNIHPNHPLQRMWKGSDGQSRPCNVCGDQVQGLFYKCSSGAAETRYGKHYFFIHPVCSKLPLQVRHLIDGNHPLKLQSVPEIRDSWCAICKKLVSSISWSYRCDPCGITIHPQCITLPYENVQSSRTRSSGTQSLGTRSTAVSQVEQAAADADALAAAMYAAKISAKSNRNILDCI
ncbi:uncharacterized protein LOC113311285 [Papaver somniferum]|uniref:uncharacterized protein LOC113311285 n=1 Tax=Papaver somniferum TaxID=3469 RepID=UPI000E6FB967|nr:uncharacterized protein LOC113311285 [Papaver somniferum]